MKQDDLAALRAANSEAWDALFRSLWPIAYGVAHARLGIAFPDEVEDVAIETLEEIVGESFQIKAFDEFPKLTRSIANNLAISRWRTLTATKRGYGRTISAAAAFPGEAQPLEQPRDLPRLDAIELKELGELLAALQADLKSEYKSALQDFFIEGLSYLETSQKRQWPVGSVGVYIRRGLEAIRRQRYNNPHLLKEAAAFLR